MFQHRLNINMMNEFLAILPSSKAKTNTMPSSSLSSAVALLLFRVSRFIVWHDIPMEFGFVCLIESRVINNYWFVNIIYNNSSSSRSRDAELFINDCVTSYSFEWNTLSFARGKQNKTKRNEKQKNKLIKSAWRRTEIFNSMWNFQLVTFHRNGMLLIIYVSWKMIKILRNQRGNTLCQHNDDVADNDIDLCTAAHSIGEISKLLLTNFICVQKFAVLCAHTAQDYFMNFDLQKQIIFNLIWRRRNHRTENAQNSGFSIRISKYHLQIIWI